MDALGAEIQAWRFDRIIAADCDRADFQAIQQPVEIDMAELYSDHQPVALDVVEAVGIELARHDCAVNVRLVLIR